MLRRKRSLLESGKHIAQFAPLEGCDKHRMLLLGFLRFMGETTRTAHAYCSGCEVVAVLVFVAFLNNL